MFGKCNVLWRLLCEIIRHPMFVCIHTGKNAVPAGTTKRGSDIAMIESDALIEYTFLRLGHVLHRIISLIVRLDENEIGSFIRRKTQPLGITRSQRYTASSDSTQAQKISAAYCSNNWHRCSSD